MPEPVLDHEGFTQTQAVALALLAQGSCESAQGCESTSDKGKAIMEDDADAGGVIDEEVNTVASSSSSSSQEMINSLPFDDDSSSNLIDELAPSTLNATGRERPDIVLAEAAIGQIIVRASHECDQPGAVGSAAASEGKLKADEAMDEADAPPKVTKVMSEADIFWQNRELSIFRDSPDQASTSSGMGQYRCEELMKLHEQPTHPTELQEQVDEPEEQILSRQFLTFGIPSFEIDYVSPGDGPVLISILDELQVEDRGVDEFLRQDHVVDED